MDGCVDVCTHTCMMQWGNVIVLNLLYFLSCAVCIVLVVLIVLYRIVLYWVMLCCMVLHRIVCKHACTCVPMCIVFVYVCLHSRIYVSMYVCLYICRYVCIYVYIYVSMRACRDTIRFRHDYSSKHRIKLHACTFAYICDHSCMHIWIGQRPKPFMRFRKMLNELVH